MSDATLISELADCRQCYDALAEKHATLLVQRDQLVAALRQVIAALEQPVQFTHPPSDQATAILRGDCAAAREMARAAIALAGGAR